MEKRYLTLDSEFIKYCELNKVENPEKLANEIFQRGFSIIKYGETPKGFKSQEKIVEVEVIKEVPVEKIVEKIIEKPVEVIKEIIKEVPVEVIKEVPVEIKGDTQVIINEVIKEVFNNEEIEKLREENEKLKDDLNKITTSLENLGKKGKFMKDSNLNSIYDE